MAITSPREGHDVRDESAASVAVLRRHGRHPGDAVRLGVGAIGLFVSLLAVQRDRLTTFEVDLFRLINDLPHHLAWVLGPLMEAGNVVAAPTIGIALAIALRRRPRIALDVAVAGGVAWVAAKLVKSMVERPRPGGLVDDVNRLLSAEGFGFVSGHTAVATAIVAASAPYLPRRVSRAFWLLPWIVGSARIFYGAHLPLDIVGGAALGWMIAAALHLVLGAPHRVPTPEDAAAILARSGATVQAIHPVGGDALGSFPFVASVPEGEVFVKLLDPEPRDRDAIYRAARVALFRDVRDEVAVRSGPEQASREAALALLARSQGVRTPQVVGIEEQGRHAWIVQEHVPATTLDALPVEQVTDDLLDRVWQQVQHLRVARIAHADLVATNVLVDVRGEPWLIDFAHASSTPRTRPLDNDVAELLVSTALIVGPERAVASARRVLDDAVLAAARPELGTLTLSRVNRQRLRRRPELLRSVRALLPRDEHTMSPAAPSVIRDRTLLEAAAAAVCAAVLLIVAGPADVLDRFQAAGLRWAGLALAAAVTARILGGALHAASLDRRLAAGRGLLIHLSARATRVRRGALAEREEILARYADAGVAPADGITCIGRMRSATAIASVVVFGVASVAAVRAEIDPRIPPRIGLALLAVAVAAVVAVAGRSGQAPVTLPRRRPSAMSVATALAASAAAAIAVIAIVESAGGMPAVAAAGALHLGVSAITDRRSPLDSPALRASVLTVGLTAAGAGLDVAVASGMVYALAVDWAPVLAVGLARQVARVSASAPPR